MKPSQLEIEAVVGVITCADIVGRPHEIQSKALMTIASTDGETAARKEACAEDMTFLKD